MIYFYIIALYINIIRYSREVFFRFYLPRVHWLSHAGLFVCLFVCLYMASHCTMGWVCF
jgi:hypothetical protein